MVVGELVGRGWRSWSFLQVKLNGSCTVNDIGEDESKENSGKCRHRVRMENAS